MSDSNEKFSFKFWAGLILAFFGIVLFLIGVLTPVDPSLAPKSQPRLSYFFFGLLPVLFGVFLIFSDTFQSKN